jgi:hypothetical protein
LLTSANAGKSLLTTALRVDLRGDKQADAPSTVAEGCAFVALLTFFLRITTVFFSEFFLWRVELKCSCS